VVDLLVVAGDADFDARCDETVAAEVMTRDIAEARFEGAIKQMSYQNVNVIAQTKIKTRKRCQNNQAATCGVSSPLSPLAC